MYKEFGASKEVFVNQDEGMFVAMPITLNSTALTLETESRGGRTYVKAGSVVKEGSIVRGILAEEYDITDGPVPARVVLEGYAWASRLTVNAIAAASSLPHIVLMPYKYVKVELVSVDTTAHTAKLRVAEGAAFASTIATTDFTLATLSFPASGGVTLNSDGTVTLTFAAAATGKITAIAGTAFVGATGAQLVGVPIELTV